MQISPHFSLDEFTFSPTALRLGIDNTPSQNVIDNLFRLAGLAESIRFLFQKPIRISSGYRAPALNEAIGGAKNSQHCLGCAMDFTIPGIPLDELFEAIRTSGLQFDQLIKEYDSWIHVSIAFEASVPPRQQVLIIDSKGKRPWHSHS